MDNHFNHSSNLLQMLNNCTKTPEYWLDQLDQLDAHAERIKQGLASEIFRVELEIEQRSCNNLSVDKLTTNLHQLRELLDIGFTHLDDVHHSRYYQ